MRSPLARPALLALALATGSCTADQTLAPAPPSLAGATPIHLEPAPLPPIPDSTSRCMKFDALAVGTRWGAVPGTVKGVVVHAENNIRMKLTDYVPASGPLQYRHAVVVNEPRYPDVLFGNSLRLDTIGVVFDFTSIPWVIGSVTFTFVDRSPLENLAVDGSAVHLGQVKDWPAQAPPVVGRAVAVALAPNNPIRGTVGIAGDLDSIRVGGSNAPPAIPVPGDTTGLWLDMVCVNKAGLSSQHQNPYPL
jgi:hypothetical protein